MAEDRTVQKKASDDNQDKEGWKAKRRERRWKMVADVWTMPNVANSVGMARFETGGKLDRENWKDNGEKGTGLDNAGLAGEEKEKKKEAAKEKPKKLFAWPFGPTERTDENTPNGVYGAVAKCRRGEKYRDSVGGHCSASLQRN